MSYATDDFTESLNRVPLQPSEIDKVVAAWGKGEGMGHDAGHYRWSESGATEWSGGFLMRLKDGRFAYVTGWCDYTGWGCQDGAEIRYYDGHPGIPTFNVSGEPPESEWDLEPSDLNKWLADGAKDPDAIDVID